MATTPWSFSVTIALRATASILAPRAISSVAGSLAGRLSPIVSTPATRSSSNLHREPRAPLKGLAHAFPRPCHSPLPLRPLWPRRGRPRGTHPRLHPWHPASPPTPRLERLPHRTGRSRRPPRPRSHPLPTRRYLLVRRLAPTGRTCTALFFPLTLPLPSSTLALAEYRVGIVCSIYRLILLSLRWSCCVSSPS